MAKNAYTPIARAAQEATTPARARRPNAKSETCFTFTERNVVGLAGPGPRDRLKSIEYTDAATPGLKVEVGRSGQGTYWWRYTYRGKKRAMRLGTVGAITLGEARGMAMECRANIDRGIDPQEGRDRIKAMPTFSEFALGPYMQWARTAKKSHDDDRSRLDNHLIPRWGNTRLCDVTRFEVDKMVSETLTIKGLSAGTVNRLLALTSAIYRQAMNWGVVDRNPCAGVKMLQESAGNENYLSVEELTRYLDALAADPNTVAAAALETLALTGCRREEILQLRWEHVDLDRGVIKLVATKNGHVRHQPLPATSITRLTAMKSVARGPWVFPGRDSPDQPIRNVLKTMNRAVKRAGIGRHVRIHDLRHSVGAQLVQSGTSLPVIAQCLGHRSMRVTQRYAHIDDGTVRGSLNAMAERLARARAANQAKQRPDEDADDTPVAA
jgi:integrase